MKIFALKINGETEWLAANIIIEALQKYTTITGIDLMGLITKMILRRCQKKNGRS